MSTANADNYARRAKSEKDPEKAIDYLTRAIGELCTTVRNLESQVIRLKRLSRG
jgi:hypothetical protein